MVIFRGGGGGGATGQETAPVMAVATFDQTTVQPVGRPERESETPMVEGGTLTGCAGTGTGNAGRVTAGAVTVVAGTVTMIPGTGI